MKAMDSITLHDVVATWIKIVEHDYGRINIRIFSKAMVTSKERAEAQEKNREYYESYKV